MKAKLPRSRSSTRSASENVFAAMGLANANLRLAKAELVQQITQVIDRAGWTQTQTAQRLGIDQPKVSALLRGQLAGFSTDRLIRFLNAIGQDVEIIIRPHQPKASTSTPSLRVVRQVA